MTLQLAVTLVTALWAKYGGTLDLGDYDEIDFHSYGMINGKEVRHCAWYAHVVKGDSFVESLGQIAMTIHEV